MNRGKELETAIRLFAGRPAFSDHGMSFPAVRSGLDGKFLQVVHNLRSLAGSYGEIEGIQPEETLVNCIAGFLDFRIFMGWIIFVFPHGFGNDNIQIADKKLICGIETFFCPVHRFQTASENGSVDFFPQCRKFCQKTFRGLLGG